ERVGDDDHRVDLTNAGRQRTIETAFVQDQPDRTQRRAGEPGDDRLGIGHLPNPCRIGEAGDLDSLDTGPNRVFDVGELVLGRDDPRLVLQGVARPDPDDLDRRRRAPAPPLEMSAPMSRAISPSGAGTSTIGSSRSSYSNRNARDIVACISYIAVT